MLGGGGSIPRPPEASTSKSVPAAPESEDEMEDDEAADDKSESDGEGSGSDGSEGMNDEELEAALAAAGKSGVDRELLRKLIGGGGGSDSGSDHEFEAEPTVGRPAAAFEYDGTDRPAPAQVETKELDPYDSYVRLLALEPRAHATDRLKTPLELAKDAAKELEEREESRLRRQRGEVDEESDEEGASKKKKQKRKPQGDDLEDDFAEASDEEMIEEGLGKGLEGGFKNQVIEDQSEEEEEEQEEEEGSEEEGSEEEGSEEDEDELHVGDLEESDEKLEDAGAPEALVSVVVEEPIKSRTWGGKDVKPELPFTFPCPATHAEFARLLSKSGIAEADTATVVKRIRVLYHPGLGEENKSKLQVRFLSGFARATG